MIIYRWMRKINVFEWREKVQNKRYVVEINVVRLYLNIVLTPQGLVTILFKCENRTILKNTIAKEGSKSDFFNYIFKKAIVSFYNLLRHLIQCKISLSINMRHSRARIKNNSSLPRKDYIFSGMITNCFRNKLNQKRKKIPKHRFKMFVHISQVTAYKQSS